MDIGQVKSMAEALAPYGSQSAGSRHTKVSISLPSDLVELVRATAADTNQTVSALIAASLRRALDEADQARLERALELDAEENVAWANAYLPVAAELLADIEW